MMALKVIVVGDPGVGKTSFIHRFTSNVFRQDYRGTVGVDFSTALLDLPGGRARVRLQLWDIAGQERFTWMTRVYYREVILQSIFSDSQSRGCIVMMDLSDRKTVASVERWKEDLDSKVKRFLFLPPFRWNSRMEDRYRLSFLQTSLT